jgi:hypothetical protein
MNNLLVGLLLLVAGTTFAQQAINNNCASKERIMKVFIDTLLIIFISMPLEIINYFFMTKIMGLGEPYHQTIVVLRYHWKYLWGQEPINQELTNVGGYLYFKLTYKDGTELLWRGP